MIHNYFSCSWVPKRKRAFSLADKILFTDQGLVLIMLKLSTSRLLSCLPSVPSLAQCSSATQSLVFQSRTSFSPQTPALVLQASFLHTTPPERSRIKQTSRHKAFWHIKKLNKADDEPVSKENKEFLQVLSLKWGHTLTGSPLGIADTAVWRAVKERACPF